MTGYQEILLILLIMVKLWATNAHIGNYGVNENEVNQMDKDIRIGIKNFSFNHSADS
jgi:carbamoyl-phosphate synthase small subunit